MFIPDVYKDVSYVLDDDSYAAAEYNDIVRKRFIKAWEGLVEGYKVSTHTVKEAVSLTWNPGHIYGEQLPTVLRTCS